MKHSFGQFVIGKQVYEPLHDRRGNIIVWSYGLPWGDETDIMKHTVYINERILANTKAGQIPKATLFIDFRSPSFRPPNKPIIKGGFEVNTKYYPWFNKFDTVFVGVPKPIQKLFEFTKPIMPKDLYERFRFAESYEEIDRWVDPKEQPMEWGGKSMWNKERIVPVRCLAEGSFCKI